ncbi:hypothetical protein, partial [Pseudomonas sp. BJa3]|uniref:hypothetical protein n=1 Tax=Pseudomonas sp. BJa3 TaxID=2986525 RepID=UPI002265CBDA
MDVQQEMTFTERAIYTLFSTPVQYRRGLRETGRKPRLHLVEVGRALLKMWHHVGVARLEADELSVV